jgi:hypothetical protein
VKLKKTGAHRRDKLVRPGLVQHLGGRLLDAAPLALEHLLEPQHELQLLSSAAAALAQTHELIERLKDRRSGIGLDDGVKGAKQLEALVACRVAKPFNAGEHERVRAVEGDGVTVEQRRPAESNLVAKAHLWPRCCDDRDPDVGRVVGWPGRAARGLVAVSHHHFSDGHRLPPIIRIPGTDEVLRWRRADPAVGACRRWPE